MKICPSSCNYQGFRVEQQDKITQGKIKSGGAGSSIWPCNPVDWRKVCISPTLQQSMASGPAFIKLSKYVLDLIPRCCLFFSWDTSLLLHSVEEMEKTPACFPSRSSLNHIHYLSDQIMTKTKAKQSKGGLSPEAVPFPGPPANSSVFGSFLQCCGSQSAGSETWWQSDDL